MTTYTIEPYVMQNDGSLWPSMDDEPCVLLIWENDRLIGSELTLADAYSCVAQHRQDGQLSKIVHEVRPL